MYNINNTIYDIENQYIQEPSKIIVDPMIPVDKMDKEIYEMDPNLKRQFSIEEETEAIKMFEKLILKKAQLENFTFIIENFDNIKLSVSEFKKLYNEFNIKFNTVPERIKSELIKLNDSIDLMVKKQRKMQIIDSSHKSHNFNEEIKEYRLNKIFGPIITDLEAYGSKNSSSVSEILKGKYNGNPVYIKVFGSSPYIKHLDSLQYEQKIYRYIKERYTMVNTIYSDPNINFSPVVVPIYDIFKVYKNDFYNYIDSGLKIKSGTNDGLIYYSSVNKKRSEVLYTDIPLPLLSNNDVLYFIITEDTSSDTYHNFFMKNLNNKDEIINTLFDIFYAIYILNTKLKINHNDIHFNNILIKPEKYKKNYYIDSVFLSRNVNYKILVYDFDFGYFDGIINSKLYNIQNKQIGKTNDLNLGRDVWTILNVMWSEVRYKFKYVLSKIDQTFDQTIKNKLESELKNLQIHYNNIYGLDTIDLSIKNYFYDLVRNVILNSKEQIEIYHDNIEKIRQHGLYWGRFCDNTIELPKCNQPNWPDLSAYHVLKRMLSNPDYSSILTFDNADAYNKKYQRLYLKYKQKYLNLKNKINYY